MICAMCFGSINKNFYVCDMCNFYRNTVPNSIILCSKKCEENYIINNLCYFCNYDKNLVLFDNKEYLKNLNITSHNIKLCNLYPGNFSCYEKCEFYCKNKKPISFDNTKCNTCYCISSQNISYNGEIFCKKCFSIFFGFNANLKNITDVDYNNKNLFLSLKKLILDG